MEEDWRSGALGAEDDGIAKRGGLGWERTPAGFSTANKLPFGRLDAGREDGDRGQYCKLQKSRDRRERKTAHAPL